MVTIVVDFDKTLIKEHLLIQFVLYNLMRTRMDTLSKARFLARAIIYGSMSMLLQKLRPTSNVGVKIAYYSLRGINQSKILASVDESQGDKYWINTNENTLEILNEIAKFMMARGLAVDSLKVTSQGSPSIAIERLLGRADFLRILSNLPALQSIICHFTCAANTLEFRDEIATGRLLPPIINKSQRLREILADTPGRCIFVGDSDDEQAIRRIGDSDVCFLNIDSFNSASIEPVLSAWLQKGA